MTLSVPYRGIPFAFVFLQDLEPIDLVQYTVSGLPESGFLAAGAEQMRRD
jgi:hypothetical protein